MDNVQKTIKQMIFYIIVFILLSGLTFWMVFKDQNINEILETFQHASLPWLIVGVSLMFGYFLMEAWNLYSLLKSFGEKVRFLQCLKFAMIGFFFCGVTPGASGGQPIEIYYMSKEKIKTANASMAVIIQTAGVQLAVMTLGIICSICYSHVLDPAVWWLLMIGLAVNGLALLVLMLCIFSPVLTKKIVHGFLKLLKAVGMRKINTKKIDESLDTYKESSVYIKNHRKEFAISMLKVLVQFSLYFMVPVTIYLGFGLSGHSLFEVFAMQAILFMSTCGLPLPGAIGASESVFLSLYSMIFGAELLHGAMILNRGITFYLFIIITMIVSFINIIIQKRKEAAKR